MDFKAGEGVPSLVLTYGTFDLFHYGHMRLLQRARSLGSRLAVGLSTDEFNALKGKRAFMSYDERAELLMACRFVDHVFPERNWEQKADDIVNLGADIFVMGDDWKGKFDHLGHLCAISYLARTPLISSTLLREGLDNCAQVQGAAGRQFSAGMNPAPVEISKRQPETVEAMAGVQTAKS